MATRSKTDSKRDLLKAALRERCRAGILAAGKPVPSVRDLSLEFGLSKDVAAASLRDLIGEGLLYSVPRVGTFVGRPQRGEADFCLLVARDGDMTHSHYAPLRVGFEDRIAGHGGVPLVLDLETALSYASAGRLPTLAGVFDLAYATPETAWANVAPQCPVARVRFHTRDGDALGYDEISFDDFDGGRQAARHLIGAGHRSVAFLALHSPTLAAERLIWSAERESGWCAALVEAGLNTASLAWHPGDEAQNDVEDAQRIGREFARHLAGRPEISAVVAVNDHAAFGLLQELQLLGIAPSLWPAIIGFDADTTLSKNLFSSMRLPWEEIGRTAADALWSRAHGQRTEKHHFRVAMKLIPRLTCRPNWSQNAGHAALATAL